MRLLITSAIATALLFVSASMASAVSFDLVLTSGLEEVGGTPTYNLVLNTEATPVQAWFLQVTHVGNSATAVTQQPFIFAGGQLASPLGAPIANSIGGGTASGQWAYTVSPPNAIPAGNNGIVFGSITFAPLAAGTYSIAVAPGGAVGGLAGLDLVAAGLVTFDSITIVPEPGTAMLVGLGLVGLGVAGRRKA